MKLDRPVAALLSAVIVLQTAIFFHLYDMQSAIPKIRTLMPPALAVEPARSAEEAAQARAYCMSDAPIWEGARSQMDYCMTSAAAGDPQAQAVVAQFYLNGSTSASKAEAYAWLKAAAQNRRDRSVAASARLRLDGLVRHLDAATLARAETQALRYIQAYGR